MNTITSIDNVFDAIREFERQVIEDREKALAEIIQKYDFVVGSKENYEKLREILPEDANIIFSQYIENPTTIFAVKKFDIMDYFDMRGKADE